MWQDVFAPSTWSNWALVVVGIAATIAALLTWWSIKREFIATHRPKLRIRKFTLKYGTPFNKPNVELTNVGDTSAMIVASHCQFIVRGSQAEAIGDFNDEVPNNPFPQKEIVGGESANTLSLKFDDQMSSTKFKTEVLTGGNAVGVLYAIGWVQYRDKNHTVRRTGFCRWRDPQTGLFLISKEIPSDYEYED